MWSSDMYYFFPFLQCRVWEDRYHLCCGLFLGCVKVWGKLSMLTYRMVHCNNTSIEVGRDISHPSSARLDIYLIQQSYKLKGHIIIKVNIDTSHNFSMHWCFFNLYSFFYRNLTVILICMKL